MLVWDGFVSSFFLFGELERDIETVPGDRLEALDLTDFPLCSIFWGYQLGRGEEKLVSLATCRLAVDCETSLDHLPDEPVDTFDVSERFWTC